jgi:hypothetical protein
MSFVYDEYKIIESQKRMNNDGKWGPYTLEPFKIHKFNDGVHRSKDRDIIVHYPDGTSALIRKSKARYGG